MKVDSLKTLEKLLKLCRKSGVQVMEVDGVKFSLGAEPYKAQPKPMEIPQDPLELAQITINSPLAAPSEFDPIAQAKAAAAKATQAIQDKINMPDELTDEQLMNFSVRDNTFESQAQ